MRSPEEELAELEQGHLRRDLRRIESPQGTVVRWKERDLLNFSSNDYLGLATDDRIKAALIEGVERFGAGSGASRLVCGSLAPHTELEERLAEHKRAEAALTFSSGYATAVGTLSALVGGEDIIILDKLCHASLIDGARLSGATIRVFPHNDLNRLERHLRWAADRIHSSVGRVLVVTESVFSMDGDRAPLREILELKERHGAWLLLDEAHAFGVLGAQGRGLAEEEGIEDERIDLRMGTLSKAVGLSGGYLCAKRAVIDLLINRARSFIYSTAPPPAIAHAAGVAVELIGGKAGNQLRSRLWENVRRLSDTLGVPGVSAIIPLIRGENEAALEAAECLANEGILVPAIRFPTVPRGQARLRVTLTSAHSAAQMDRLFAALKSLD